MKYYLAARFSRQAEMKTVASRLRAMGHAVTSRWLTIQRPAQPEQATDEERAEQATMNERDMLEADVIVSFLGRHVEFGFALARNKVCMIVGEPENVFHFHPRVIRIASANALIVDAEKRATEAERRRP
jgi:hypothetical protein